MFNNNYANMSLGMAVFILLFVVPGALFLGGLFLMLLIGVLHDWWPAIPTMSYWTAFVASLLKGALFVRGTNFKSNDA